MAYLMNDTAIRAVLFTNLQSVAVPFVKAWCESGNSIEGVVAEERSRKVFERSEKHALFGPQWSWKKSLARYAPSADITFLPNESKWDHWSKIADRYEADILISIHFMSKIPNHVLGSFPMGGVNFHPALLPQYAGVWPIRQMIADNTYQNSAGVTLHVVTEKFDEGPIIAQAPFMESAWESERAFGSSIAGAIAQLSSTSLIDWCRGKRESVQQDFTKRSWAGLSNTPLIVEADWTFEQLLVANRFLYRKPGLAVKIEGEGVSLFPKIERIGDPTGQAAIVANNKIEFDILDAKVSSKPASRLAKPFLKLSHRMKRITSHPILPKTIR